MTDNNNINIEPISHDDMVVMEQARMAIRRHDTPCPDIDDAWSSLCLEMDGESSNGSNDISDDNKKAEIKEISPSKRGGATKIQLVIAAILGAAAMLLAVFVFDKMNPEPAIEGVVALAYDDTPQHITLQQGDEKLTNLTGRDSISFFSSKAVGNKSVAQQTAQAKTQRLSTPRGMDFKVTLSDGSEVWLNAESTIEFPTAFSATSRSVKLSGEAYFKIAHNEKAPFTVISDRMNVRVLGTEFNMKAYKAETPHVSLVKGSVEILGANKRLKPGEDAWCDKDGNVFINPIDTYGVVQWVDGYFYFDDVPLASVLREMGRWYNLGVVFRKQSLMTTKLHFSAPRHETLDDALNDISQLLHVKISVEGTNIVVG